MRQWMITWMHHDVRRRLEAGENFYVIDVREESEWLRGHLPVILI
jgi:rhodanese-related sulfurtransferase